MADAPKITMVGAGGMSFGPTMANDVIHTAALRGARLMLHDLNPERLDRAYQFANKLNAASGSPILIDRSTDAEAALVERHARDAHRDRGDLRHGTVLSRPYSGLIPACFATPDHFFRSLRISVTSAL